jgi:signal transduction histidine kinase
MLNSKLIPLLYPDYNWYIAFGIEYIIHFSIFGFLIAFMDKLYPSMFNKIIIRLYYLISIIYILMLFIIETTRYHNLLGSYDIIMIVTAVYVIISIILYAKRKFNVQIMLSCLGIVIVILFGINDIMYSKISGIVDQSIFTIPFAMILFVFLNTIILSIQHAENERLMFEMKENENKLSANNEALDRINRMKSDLIATVSHETRTPLAVLSGYAELISLELREKGVDAQTTKDLDNIAEETQRIAVLMDELQKMSGEKEISINKVPLNIEKIIVSVANMYRPILKRKNTVLEISIKDELPKVYANASEITQVLFNLLQNSRNHVSDGLIIISAEGEDEYINIIISDNGSGISDELMPKIFYKGISGDKNSSGLGLSICKKIIEEHGGSINIESKINMGTKVKIVLPAAKEGCTYES